MKIVKSGNRINNKFLLAGAIAVFTIIFFAKSIFFAALVNGTPIMRYSVIKELEKQNGKQALESLITKKLILQTAKKKNIEVKQSDLSPAKGFSHFSKYFNSARMLQVVKECKKDKTYPSGLAVKSLIPWLAELDLIS